MSRAGVAIAAVASLGMGGMAVASAAPADAATVAASGGSLPTGAVGALLANLEGTVGGVVANVGQYVGLVESVGCFVVDILTTVGPPYPPPGNGCLGG